MGFDIHSNNRFYHLESDGLFLSVNGFLANNAPPPSNDVLTKRFSMGCDNPAMTCPYLIPVAAASSVPNLQSSKTKSLTYNTGASSFRDTSYTIIPTFAKLFRTFCLLSQASENAIIFVGKLTRVSIRSAVYLACLA